MSSSAWSLPTDRRPIGGCVGVKVTLEPSGATLTPYQLPPRLTICGSGITSPLLSETFITRPSPSASTNRASQA